MQLALRHSNRDNSHIVNNHIRSSHHARNTPRSGRPSGRQGGDTGPTSPLPTFQIPLRQERTSRTENNRHDDGADVGAGEQGA